MKTAELFGLTVPRKILLRADAAARAADARVIRVEASLHEELREILVATSAGKLVHDRQPMVRFSVRVIVEDKGKRQSGSSGGGRYSAPRMCARPLGSIAAYSLGS